ncbi:DUF7003 family protein [Streptomyces nodosus]|uniref:DUF7003 family protein n=1 Tax=Streptomyces nodosus TaxID=40318 RepID=UPI0037F116B6
MSPVTATRTGDRRPGLRDETELRAGIPSDLPELMRLDERNEPRDLWDVMPSGHETFQMIAEVLDSGDPIRYRPTLLANTHWSHWPDAGTL